MAAEVTIPRLGWNMEEGVFVAWLKKDGDEVRPGDALFTLEGEKATEDIEFLETGILRISPDGPQPGDKVAVGAVIGYVTRPGEAAPEPRPDAGPPKGEAAAEERPAPAAGEAPAERARNRASPRARRTARELGIDWAQVSGGGRAGRVRERDVRAAAKQARDGQGAVIPVSVIRRTIAERLTASLRAAAPVTLTTTADATNLVNLRKQFRAAAEGDVVPGYTDFFIKLSAAALRKHPMLAARWEGDTILLPGRIDIGVAVDADAGLFVPVVRDVPGRSIRQVAAATRELAENARRGVLHASDMQGGVFTVTNLGAFGVDAFTPIINHPECAVLGVGRIARRPAVVGDQIIACEQVTMSLTFDHRVVDGAPAARFLQTLVQHVENPGPGLMP